MGSFVVFSMSDFSGDEVHAVEANGCIERYRVTLIAQRSCEA